jgi:hypothetical protein
VYSQVSRNIIVTIITTVVIEKLSAEDSEDIDRLVPEIKMLKFVLFLVCRNERKEEHD